MKMHSLLLLASLLALPLVARADAGPIGSELPFIEGPPDLVQSLRDSFAAGRPRKKSPKAVKTAEKASKKAKPRLAQVKEEKTQEKD